MRPRATLPTFEFGIGVSRRLRGCRPHAPAGPRRVPVCWWPSPAVSPMAAALIFSSASVRFHAWRGYAIWSVSEAGWRTLITHATVLDGPDLGHPRKDFTVAEMKSGAELYFAQSDNRASGDIIYRMQVKQADPSRLVIAIENVTAVRRFLIPFFEPGNRFTTSNETGRACGAITAWPGPASTCHRSSWFRRRPTSTARSHCTATLPAVPIAR